MRLGDYVDIYSSYVPARNELDNRADVSLLLGDIRVDLDDKIGQLRTLVSDYLVDYLYVEVYGEQPLF